jgi:hypothetical protein
MPPTAFRPKPKRVPTKTAQAAASSSLSGKITVKEFNDVLAQASRPDAVFTSEAFSLGSWWEQISLTRPKLHSPRGHIHTFGKQGHH